MLFPSAESSLDANLFVPNSFLIFRLVFFALLSNLALLQLIFASWNINASLSMTLSAPSTSIFIIFESCLLFFSLAFALADFVWSRGRRSRIFLECSWVGIVSLLQIGTAIGTTITGPGLACDTSLEWNVCASSWLLIPSTWLSSILYLAYFLALFMTTMAHTGLYSDIWRRSVYGVAWFGRSHEVVSKSDATGRLSVVNQNEDIENSSAQKQLNRMSDSLKTTSVEKTLPNVDPYVNHSEDIENSSTRKQLHPVSDSVENTSVENTPKTTVRRGIDTPFSRHPNGTCSNTSSPTISPTISSFTLPSCLDKSAKSEVGSRFVETFRESTLLARSESSEHFVANYQIPEDPLPPLIIDIDAPIPLPRLSEWVRADEIKGISVHTNPHTSIGIA